MLCLTAITKWPQVAFSRAAESFRWRCKHCDWIKKIFCIRRRYRPQHRRRQHVNDPSLRLMKLLTMTQSATAGSFCMIASTISPTFLTKWVFWSILCDVVTFSLNLFLLSTAPRWLWRYSRVRWPWCESSVSWTPEICSNDAKKVWNWWTARTWVHLSTRRIFAMRRIASLTRVTALADALFSLPIYSISHSINSSIYFSVISHL